MTGAAPQADFMSPAAGLDGRRARRERGRTAVVDALFAAFGTRVPTRITGNYRVGDIRHNVADTARMREVLGFEPRVPFSEGVSRFVQWVLSEPVEVDNYERSLREMATRNLLK